MSIEEKLSLEKADSQVIRLYKEGKFWRAYNYSALLFCRYISEVKILKLEKKNGEWYIYIGVLEESDILKPYNLNDLETTIIDCPNSEKLNLEDVVPFKIINTSKKKKNITIGKENNSPITKQNKERTVLERIRNSNLCDITPMQALSLLNELQSLLKE